MGSNDRNNNNYNDKTSSDVNIFSPNFLVYDIETLREMFLIGIYDPVENEYIEFEVSRSKNQLDSFVNYALRHVENYLWVGYNNIRFDSQIIEWIIRNYEKWHDLSTLEICAIIAQKAADVIHDANYEVFPEYRESDMTLSQLDLFKVNHYDNKNRMVSLKRLQFEMDYENIEEMPIHHTKINMTATERHVTRIYCKNDVMSTYEFLKITLGDTPHPLYKENNQIQLRADIENEFGIKCTNFSDSKIGDEMIKKYYIQEKNIEYNNLPRKGFFRKEIHLKNCIAQYVEFETDQLNNFLRRIRKTTLGMNDDFMEEIDFYGVKYTFAKGGLHSVNKPEIFEADDDYFIIDWDVDSYYPAIIINNGRYPAHLGKEFLVGYEKLFKKRLELKPLAKNDKRIKGIVGGLKLAVNSVYGKSSDVQSWIYDRQLTMFTTITGELSLMMLIEKYELNGIKVISANTDGVTLRIHKDLVDKMFEINNWWCEITKYQLSRTDYKKIIFSTVNDYLAIDTNGEVKKKGDFLTDFELHKNKSARIVPIALERYFVDNIPVDETIRAHTNLYDFCLRQKATKDFHYEGIIVKQKDIPEEELQKVINSKWKKVSWWDKKEYWLNEGTVQTDQFAGFTSEQMRNIINYEFKMNSAKRSVYNKLIRYYISNEGEKLLKIKNDTCDTKAAKISQVEAGEWLSTVCNYLPKNSSVSNVNFTYYIDKAENMLLKIQTKGKKTKKEVRDPDQITLFD